MNNLLTSSNSKKLIKEVYLQSETYKEYSLWQEKFEAIHGIFDKQKKVDLSSLSIHYNIDIKNTEDLFRLIFSLENYYVWLIKQLTYIAILKKKNIKHIKHCIDNLYVKNYGIKNFDIDAIYLFLDNNSNRLLNDLKEEIFYDEILVVDIDNLKNFDYIREIYQVIFDKRIRHSMGEFFTPDWLAEFVIEETVNNDNISKKLFMDPTCGTGTFLVQIINKFKYITKGEIFDCIYGIDINPISVIAAKVNYLLLYLDYFEDIPINGLEIPIFEANVINKNNDILQDIQKVDYIIGNPPWVNWEYLPTNYKNNTKFAWEYYHLYSGKGLDSNFLKEDISCLIVYSVVDKYLKNDGKLGFLLKESLIKSSRQAKSFRNFFVKPGNIPLKIDKVIDLTHIKPFEGINPRTISLFLTKNKITKYPIKYSIWKNKTSKKSFDIHSRMKDIRKNISFEDILAEPIDDKDITSSWKTLPKDFLKLSNKIRGKSEYKARTGVFCGGGNAMFWLDIKEKKRNILKVQNIIARAKNKVEQITVDIEEDYVFPFVTGADISFWNYKYSKYIIFPHTVDTKMYPIDNNTLSKLPYTKSYFDFFKNDLEKRKGFTGLDKHIHKDYYYTLQRIGEYTFENYKVAWKYISKSFCPVVIENVEDKFLNKKNIIPNEKVIYIGLSSKEEAYYLCGLLSSDLFRTTIESFMIGTQITPSIINNLNIQKYDTSNLYHKKISDLCLLGHKNNTCYETYLNDINSIVYKQFT